MGDVSETVTGAIEKSEQGSDKFLNLIAAMVAVLATVMAICNVKDGNIVQAMAQAQSRSVNAWSYFQAKSTKQNLAESVLDQLMIERERSAKSSAESLALLDKKIAFYREKVSRYETEKEEIKKKAEAYEGEYDQLNVRDDQFDVAEAGITVAISLLGIAALTRRKWLVWFSLIFVSFGLASAIAGFVGGSFHMDFVAKLLS